MISFSSEESTACRRLVQLALEEDLGSAGDATSQAIIPEDLEGQAGFVARNEGVLAGLPAAQMVFAELRRNVTFKALLADGMPLQAGSRIATINGSMRAILAGERTALNFLQRLSGIATLTRCFVNQIVGLTCRILDTRKTTPGWRLLEKYAVRCGGGHNHRMGLYDGILIKDNHLAALCGGHATITRALTLVRKGLGHGRRVEIEVDDLDHLDTALKSEPDIVLLDNMSLEWLREAVRRRN